MGGQTALSWAAWHGHSNIVQELIKSRATINLPDRSGSTALDYAKKGGETELVQFLEDALVTRPLQVFAVMDSAAISVMCVNMAGDELARFTLDPDAKFRLVFELVREHLPLQVGIWTIILPTGQIPDETQSDVSVKFLFDLQAASKIAEHQTLLKNLLAPIHTET